MGESMELNRVLIRRGILSGVLGKKLSKSSHTAPTMFSMRSER